VRREEEESKVAADGFGVAGVEVGDEEEGDAEDDEGDEAVERVRNAVATSLTCYLKGAPISV
jgi:hypothetical protein